MFTLYTRASKHDATAPSVNTALIDTRIRPTKTDSARRPPLRSIPSPSVLPQPGRPRDSATASARSGRPPSSTAPATPSPSSCPVSPACFSSIPLATRRRSPPSPRPPPPPPPMQLTPLASPGRAPPPRPRTPRRRSGRRPPSRPAGTAPLCRPRSPPPTSTAAPAAYSPPSRSGPGADPGRRGPEPAGCRRVAVSPAHMRADRLRSRPPPEGAGPGIFFNSQGPRVLGGRARDGSSLGEMCRSFPVSPFSRFLYPPAGRTERSRARPACCPRLPANRQPWSQGPGLAGARAADKNAGERKNATPTARPGGRGAII